MKSNAQTSAAQQSSQPAQSQSPYLRAILSSKVMSARNERDYDSNFSDRAAASRYIKASRQSNKY